MPIKETSAAWFEGKSFSADWISNKLSNWERNLRSFTGRPTKILELGSYEGRSAIAFLNLLPDSHITCVDFFREHLDATFDANLAEYLPRLEKRRENALIVLKKLAQGERQFDIIYLDAGKKRDHVYAMSLLTWPLLLPGGLIIWDDYSWGNDKPNEERPKDAIDRFIVEKSDELQVIQITSQVFARKIVK